MKKAHRKASGPLMRRASRIFLNDVNAGKAQIVRDFLHQCRDVTQYFVDLFWQRQDFTADLAAWQRCTVREAALGSQHAWRKRSPNRRRRSVGLPTRTGIASPICGAGRQHSTPTSSAWRRLLARTLTTRCASSALVPHG